MKNEIDVLLGLLTENGIETDPGFSQKICEFSDFFLETLKTLNLTAIKEPHQIMLKHYFDSLYPLKVCNFIKNANIIDIGCGGGFPSIPIKLARPDIDMVQLDSVKKRLAFLDNAAALLKLEHIHTVHARAEEAGRDKQLRDSFDISMSRAVAPLNILCEYCMPFVKPGGMFLAYKGTPDSDEIEAAMPAIKALSGEISQIIRYELPENTGARTLVIISKLKPTHPAYPRSTKNMSKNAIK